MTEKRKNSSGNFQISESQAEPWIDPDDAPELTDELLDRVADKIVWRQGDKIIRRGRPPLGPQAKSVVTIRLDPDVLEAYRALGAGWQTQVNADLRRARKLGKKLKTA